MEANLNFVQGVPLGTLEVHGGECVAGLVQFDCDLQSYTVFGSVPCLGRPVPLLEGLAVPSGLPIRGWELGGDLLSMLLYLGSSYAFVALVLYLRKRSQQAQLRQPLMMSSNIPA